MMIFTLLTALFLSPVHAKTLFEGHFSGTDWLARFNKFYPPPWTEGLERASVVKSDDKTVLKVLYPAKKFGNDFTGVQWRTYFDKPYEQLTLSYRVKFENGFDFVKGGKLPGLVGGHRAGSPESVVSGGHKPSGNEGWSARIMWRSGGRVVQYLYHLDQPGTYGEDLNWRVNGAPAVFVPGRWHTVKTEIKMNTPGKKDGMLRSWFDGQPALERTNLRFRNAAEIGIDSLYFSTFFGGDDASWATKKDEYVYFDAFEVIY